MKRKAIIPLVLLLMMISSSPTAVHSQELTPAKNVILIIGDGMGYEHLRLGSYIEHGNDSGLFIQQEQFDMGNMTVHSADENITDSAASATAMATGWKVDNGRISRLNNGTTVQTILEYSQLMNKKTGLISNSYFYHATPAAFAAHVDGRSDYEDIVKDMITSDTDLIMGGAVHNPGVRSNVDFDNLVADNNYNVITSKEDLAPVGKEKTLGLFGDGGHMPYEADMDYSTDVRLTDMVTAGLGNLENENGFFLMIEGARIDHAGHARNVTQDALEVIEFDRTVKTVYDWVQDNPDTVVIVTADHETGGLVIEGTDGLDDNLPNDTMTEVEKRERRIARVAQIDATLPTTSHTRQNTPLFAFGDNIDSIFTEEEGHIYDNTDIYRLLRTSLDGSKFTETFGDIGIPIETPQQEPEPSSSSNEDTNFQIVSVMVSLLILTPAITTLLRRKQRI